MKQIRQLIFDKGFLLTFFIASLCLIYFFGKLLIHPNEVYFGSDGDGLQSYYNALYHVKFDASYWHFTGQNYPFGEHVFFTGCQPFVTNIIKFTSTIIDISDYTIAIINLIMLFSIALSALVIYLIFKHLRLSFLFSAFAATAIAFLSPQIIRLSGHYTLTYQFAIPLFLFLLLKFYEAPSIKKSVFLAIISFFMAGTHLYFYGFYVLISLVFWIGLFLLRDGQFSKIRFMLKHFFIQVALPFILLQAILLLTNSVTDRTTTPWGFLVYRSNPTGVFFPIGKPYAHLLSYFIKPKIGAWEGWAYIGIVALTVFIALIVIFLKYLIKRNWKQIPGIDNKILNLFFIAALFGLFLSFGLPFKIKGCEFLLNYAGLLKQMRGIGRFSWIFYYVINIIACYKIYHWCSKLNTFYKYTLLSICLFFLSFDAYTTVRGLQNQYDNSIPQIADSKNLLPENNWLKKISVDQYQAIIPLPFIHVGSENIWMVPSENKIMKNVFIVSLKTGLPTTMSMLSRTSLSQTFKSIQPFQEPYNPLKIVNDFHNQKPFLVLANESQLNENEKELLSQCSKLYETQNYNVYQLNYQVLQHYTDSLFIKKENEYSQTKKFDFNGFQSNDSLNKFLLYGFDDQKSENIFFGKGAYEGLIKNENLLFKGKIPFAKDEKCVFSFWMNNFTTDLYPRSTLELKKSDSLGNTYHIDTLNLGQELKIIDGSWALIEDTFRLKKTSDILQISLKNKELPQTAPLNVDELLIRANSTNVYRTDIKTKEIWINNRTYHNTEVHK